MLPTVMQPGVESDNQSQVPPCASCTPAASFILRTARPHRAWLHLFPRPDHLLILRARISLPLPTSPGSAVSLCPLGPRDHSMSRLCIGMLCPAGSSPGTTGQPANPLPMGSGQDYKQSYWKLGCHPAPKPTPSSNPQMGRY